MLLDIKRESGRMIFIIEEDDMIGKQVEIMKQASDLLETVVEGLLHPKELLNEGKFEQSTRLFSDIIQGFSAIESSLTRLSEGVLPAGMADQTVKVCKHSSQ